MRDQYYYINKCLHVCIQNKRQSARSKRCELYLDLSIWTFLVVEVYTSIFIYISIPKRIYDGYAALMVTELGNLSGIAACCAYVPLEDRAFHMHIHTQTKQILKKEQKQTRKKEKNWQFVCVDLSSVFPFFFFFSLLTLIC